MTELFQQLKLDFRIMTLDLEEFLFALICDLLLLIPGYALIYFLPEFSTSVAALMICLVVVINGILLIPRPVFRERNNNWIFQACASGMFPQHYYLAKIISGFLSLFSISYIFYLFLQIFFYRQIRWLIGGTLILFLLVPAVVLVLVLCTLISVDNNKILALALAGPLLLPAVFAGYILFYNLGKQFALSRAWAYWLSSYNLIFLVAGWFLSEYLWEEFYW